LAKIEKTLWSPDTCECSIIFSWDSDLPVEERVHKGHSIEKACEAHKDIQHAYKHHDIVLEENQRKNRTHGEVGIDKTITWEFDSDRTLHVYHEGKKIKEVVKPR
jgi:hypothetical protein